MIKSRSQSRKGELIAFGQSVESAPLLSDVEFFAGIAWENSAPARLRRAGRDGDCARIVELVLQAGGGKRPAPRKADLPRQSLWLRHHLQESTPQDSPRAATLIGAWNVHSARSNGRGNGPRNGQVHKIGRGSIDVDVAALNRFSAMCTDGVPPSLVETRVLFEILRDAGRQIHSALAGKLWRIALTAAIQKTGEPSGNSGRLGGGRLLDAELAWQSGLLFGPVSGAAAVAASAREELATMLVEQTDAAGVPAAEIVDDLATWLATFVRGREWGRRFGRPLLDPAQEKRFRAFLGAVSRMCRGDGRPAFSNGRTNELRGLWTAVAESLVHRPSAALPALKYLVSLEEGSTRRSSMRSVRNGRRSRESNGRRRRKTSNPVFQSDTSRLACLRSGWTHDADALTVLHHQRFPRLELAARGAMLLAGEWEIAIRAGNEDVHISGPWVCSCWYSDDEGDYLELQAQATPEIRIERQLLLARGDHLLFLADAVTGPGDLRLDYWSRLPLVPAVQIEHHTRTRECRLAGTDVPARVFPLGLACERSYSALGKLAGSSPHLELRQSAIGGLYAPLVIDWDPARRRRPALWRTLTVAQDGAAVPARSAAAFRLQVGSSQWLIYRSLSRILEPRTVLGQHTMYETMIGRFAKSGEVEPMVLVEQRAEGAE